MSESLAKNAEKKLREATEASDAEQLDVARAPSPPNLHSNESNDGDAHAADDVMLSLSAKLQKYIAPVSKFASIMYEGSPRLPKKPLRPLTDEGASVSSSTINFSRCA